ncbi:DNA polymerase III subunit delta' [Helicobacter sp. 23-1045]
MNEIIIANDIFAKVQILRDSIQNTRIFPISPDEFKKGEFKIKHAREAINESTIAESSLKTIILVGEKFNIEAQNALLKVLEESPQNVKFILVTKYKSAILPTILSRLLIKNERTKSDILPFALDVSRLNLEGIMAFLDTINLQTNIPNFLNTADAEIRREEIRLKVASLLFAVREAGLSLNERELACFDKAIREIESYEQPKYIFLKLLLMLLEHNKRARK